MRRLKLFYFTAAFDWWNSSRLIQDGDQWKLATWEISGFPNHKKLQWFNSGDQWFSSKNSSWFKRFKTIWFYPGWVYSPHWWSRNLYQRFPTPQEPVSFIYLHDFTDSEMIMLAGSLKIMNKHGGEVLYASPKTVRTNFRLVAHAKLLRMDPTFSRADLNLWKFQLPGMRI